MEHKATRMPPKVHQAFSTLEDDFLRLRHKWTTFRVVYLEAEDRVPLLNKFAGGFFGMIQRVLVDDVILSLGRLLDSKRTLGQDNLSLRQLTHRIRVSGQSNLADDLDRVRKSAETKIKSLQTHRHKRLAHRDLKVAVQDQPLPGITIHDVDEVLTAVEHTLAMVLMAYDQTDTSFEVVFADRSARQLIHNIKEWDASRQTMVEHRPPRTRRPPGATSA